MDEEYENSNELNDEAKHNNNDSSIKIYTDTSKKNKGVK